MPIDFEDRTKGTTSDRVTRHALAISAFMEKRYLDLIADSMTRKEVDVAMFEGALGAIEWAVTLCRILGVSDSSIDRAVDTAKRKVRP